MSIKTLTSLGEFQDAVRKYMPDPDMDLLERAYVFSSNVHAGVERSCGGSAFSHTCAVASMVVRLQLDIVTVAAALVHDVLERNLITVDELHVELGAEVVHLVEGLTKINSIIYQRGQERDTESFRKMLLAIARDVRIVLLKLADRLHSMQTLGLLPPKDQIRIARETLEVYAPLANRMGISWVKSQLEDLCFKHLYPEEYKELRRKIRQFKTDANEQYIQGVIEHIQDKLKSSGIDGQVSGRSKHLYSVYRKIKRQNIDLDQVYDLIAFRIIVNTVRDCYACLGIIHAAWKPVSGRFKDYVAMPKANMYQSLHTSVIGPYGKRMEVQIRTEEMHRIAEEGIAAHWKYKESNASVPVAEDGRFSWLRHMLEWQKELNSAHKVNAQTQLDLFPEEVYVFTPDGHVRELPRGSCPIDFAYSIHGDVGNRCVGAKVNGKMVALKTPLLNGDVVEILTSSTQTPSKDWLNLAKTSKARNRIRHWIKTQEREKSIEIGREVLERELRKHKASLNKILHEKIMTEVVKGFGFKGSDEMLAAIGYGKLSALLVAGKLLPEVDMRPPGGKIQALGRIFGKVRKKPAADPIRIQGKDNIMVRFAKCCTPLPGDAIVGFITRGRGITVHSATCSHLLETDPQRRVEVAWDEGVKAVRNVKVNVLCADTKGILAEITNVINQREADIVAASIHAHGQRGLNEFELAVESVDHLNQVMASLKGIKGVRRVERVGER
ncbi:MAG: bifunctional (p)ppGpp synthetase/guanosine-3',5'-bis(diphosphate) 3'-pyrophosphohydrolase [Desulfuromonadaceae bacterium]|nr:bifunctional (p)ppGpp synthetase/guanosine-3',5'-bis(diphosphate) 3'-pyrophosphohydrolase [Desulfuromonas sp.]MDY0185200.1 bifunctional (p)ppGpp synthetase/guanosine-3',5'-bis(diphosphate) 3'-pyrophosphohydrolase [Desulfuromonadaceae bacterium]